jgi:hypothetical protein
MLLLATADRRLAEAIPAYFSVREYVNLCYTFSSGLRLDVRSTRDIFTIGNHYDR